VKVNTKSVKEYFVTGLRKTRAMMRDVSWALASCTATSKAEETKTMKVNMDAARVSSTVRALSGSLPACQPVASSIPWRNRTSTSAAGMLRNGRIQMECRT